MARLISKSSKKVGAPPGTLQYVGNKEAVKTRISIMDYHQKDFREREVEHIEDCFPFRSTPTVTWLNIDGLHEVDIIDAVGTFYDVHPLVLEDILHTNQRPKLEVFDDYLFIVVRMLSFDEIESKIVSEQVSLVLGENYVISFQELEGDVLDPLRERIRTGKGRIRDLGTDYLTYAILDVVIDNYYIILEKMGEKIEGFEEELMFEPKQNLLQDIYALKREILFLRKSVWPLREAVSAIEKSESRLISKKTRPFLRDLYDHTIQVIDTVETSRDLLGGMLDLYLSSVSNKMNEVMKVLTIIATIFIPLTFIAGVYGMNFQYIPELGWHWGYFIILGIMLVVAMVMILYFKRKKWL
ncbi:MAG TPA: magnesium/cobalt transporter CorA [Sunxiuqinia sp.]|nr:magnesium/cobalt transporter CorA [Sunxiuqinia sp.]